jgi:hypothetical protein
VTVRSAGTALGIVGLALVLAACRSGPTGAVPASSASTVPGFTTSTTNAAAAPPTTVVVPTPAATASYLGAIDPVVSSANLQVTLADSSTGTNDELDLVQGTGVEIDPTSGYGQALVNLAGVGYQDNQGGDGSLLRLTGADALTVDGVRQVLQADLSAATAVQTVTPNRLEVTFSFDPLASLVAQVAQVTKTPGALPTATTGSSVTDQVVLVGGIVTEIIGADGGRSVTLSLVPGAAHLPEAP